MKNVYYLMAVMLLTACGNAHDTRNKFKGIDVSSVDSIKEPPRLNGGILELDLSVLRKGREAMERDFSTLIEDYYLVFLETTERNLIGEINKIQVVDSLIFINDPFVANKLLLYNMNGEFIRQISHPGGGPGEYIQATDFYYDEALEEVLIYDQFKSKIFHYRLNGEYIKEDRQSFRYIQFAKLENEHLCKNLSGNEHLPLIDKSSLTILTDSMRFKYACLPMLDMDYVGGKLQNIGSERVAYSMPFCDTIYHYTRDLIEAKYHLKIPEEMKLPKDFEEKSSNSYEKFGKKYFSDKYAFFLGDFVENNSHLHFAYVTHRGYLSFYYDKATSGLDGGNSVYHSDGSLCSFFSYHRPMAYSGDYFISVIPTSNLSMLILHGTTLSDDEPFRDKLVNLEMDDNPVLFFFKVKSI